MKYNLFFFFNARETRVETINLRVYLGTNTRSWLVPNTLSRATPVAGSTGVTFWVLHKVALFSLREYCCSKLKTKKEAHFWEACWEALLKPRVAKCLFKQHRSGEKKEQLFENTEKNSASEREKSATFYQPCFKHLGIKRRKSWRTHKIIFLNK